MRSGWRSALAAAGLAMLVASACSGDDGDDGVTTTTASSVTTTAPAGEAGGGSGASTSGTDNCGPVEELVEPRASTHVLSEEAAEFENHPPTSGPHLLDMPVSGPHDDPVPEAAQVLALEHGLVVLHYREDVAPELIEALEIMAGERDDVIVTPAAHPIDDGAAAAFTAWHHRQLCARSSFTVVDAAEAFVEEFAGAITGHP